MEDYEKVLTYRSLPAAVPDGIWKDQRGGRYGERTVTPTMLSQHTLADEGTYFVATNPTPGTAIVAAINSTVSETAGYFLVVRNNDSVSNPVAKRLYLDYIRLICNVVPASGTSGEFFMRLTGSNNYTSGGSALTPYNVNGDSPNSSLAQVYAGALTTVAVQSSRILTRGKLRSVIPVVNDEFLLNFGGIEGAAPGSLGGAVALRIPVPCPPIVLGPGQNAALQLWFPSNAATAAQFEVEVGWWER